MDEMEKVVEIDCITHIYPDMTKLQICGLEFVVNRGERVTILVPTGAGRRPCSNILSVFLCPRTAVSGFSASTPGRISRESGRGSALSCRTWMSRSWGPPFTTMSSLPPELWYSKGEGRGLGQRGDREAEHRVDPGKDRALPLRGRKEEGGFGGCPGSGTRSPDPGRTLCGIGSAVPEGSRSDA